MMTEWEQKAAKTAADEIRHWADQVESGAWLATFESEGRSTHVKRVKLEPIPDSYLGQDRWGDISGREGK